MSIALLLVMVASVLASGRLFTHGRVSVFIASAATLAIAHWLALKLLTQLLIPVISLPTTFLLGSVGLAVLWLSQWRLIKIPGVHTTISFKQELVPIVAILIVLLGATPVLMSNGWQAGDWVMRGFYHGDTTTFVSLVQKSIINEGVVTENPFAGNGPLEYPTLLHAGMAHFLDAVSAQDQLLALLPWLTIGMIIITIPLLFLVWDVLIKPPGTPHHLWFGLMSEKGVLLAQLSLGLYVLALSWDTFVYPQSHFFLTGLFMLAAALYAGSHGQRGVAQILPVAAASVVSLVLLWSNAVTGTAALAIALVFYGIRTFDRSRAVGERIVYLCLIPVGFVCFFIASPGNGGLGILPGLAYTAVPDMLRLALVVLVLVIAVFWQADKQPFVTASVTGLIFLAVFTFIFSSRNIVVANASRFLYHGILIGWPLLIYPVLRVGAWLRRELIYAAHTAAVSISLWALSVLLLVIFTLPALASGASTYDSLVRSKPTAVDAKEIAVYEELAMKAPHDAVVVANPDSPWLVPLFTGRALLRTHYWLDPSDDMTAQVAAAFSGDTGAQQDVLRYADYLLLTSEEVDWVVISQPPTWQGGSTRIWQLRE